ncbi:hypothetical protein LP420_03710 [Massilia sp. B-10]|nr:hypothetical protein LP420_03710 [Massilia sp. B-10]
MMAGARARRSAAFDAARHYYDQAAGLTPDSAWQEQIEATFALHSELAECEYLCGNLDRAGRLFAQLAAHARSRLALARVALMRVALYQVSGRFDLAAAVALRGARAVRHQLPGRGGRNRRIAGRRAGGRAAPHGRAQHRRTGAGEPERRPGTGDRGRAAVGHGLVRVFGAPRTVSAAGGQGAQFHAALRQHGHQLHDLFQLRDHAGVAGRHSRRIRVFRTGAAAGRARRRQRQHGCG